MVVWWDEKDGMIRGLGSLKQGAGDFQAAYAVQTRYNPPLD
ncbi:hypothetical protein [Kingella oralis]|jgi:hypothetical protein|nr:hypothetical protein [Kingella oralis]